MLCEECGLNKAIVNYSRIENNMIKEMHICGDCLQKHLAEDIYTPLFADQQLNSFMEQIFSMFLDKDETAEETIRCKYCNTSLEEFKKTSLFGCSHCYETFANEIDRLLPKIQGTTSHIGYTEEANQTDYFDQGLDVDKQKEIIELEKELRISIQEERYEDSAIIRDKIKALKDE